MGDRIKFKVIVDPDQLEFLEKLAEKKTIQFKKRVSKTSIIRALIQRERDNLEYKEKVWEDDL